MLLFFSAHFYCLSLSLSLSLSLAMGLFPFIDVIKHCGQQCFNWLRAKREEAKLGPQSTQNDVYFNYFLVDESQMSFECDFPIFHFAEAVIYVGKSCKQNRHDMDHLRETLAIAKKEGFPMKKDKQRLIYLLTQSGLEYFPFRVFEGSSEQKALAREFLVIKALGIWNLTNESVGDEEAARKLGISPYDFLALGYITLHTVK